MNTFLANLPFITQYWPLVEAFAHIKAHITSNLRYIFAVKSDSFRMENLKELFNRSNNMVPKHKCLAIASANRAHLISSLTLGHKCMHKCIPYMLSHSIYTESLRHLLSLWLASINFVACFTLHVTLPSI